MPGARSARTEAPRRAAGSAEGRPLAAGGVVAYSNRLPVSEGTQGWRPSSGGLVSALRPALSQGEGAWVGWAGSGGRGLPRRVGGLPIDLWPVSLSRREVDGYYHGFSNRTLWPLLHGLIEDPVFDRGWWRAYRAVNERFAATEVPGVEPGALRWVHDYHLLLVPEFLRRRGADGPIGFFLHVPFPAPEIFARLPWREQVLAGVLGADVVSFHTEDYRDNFVRTCRRILDDVEVEGETIWRRGRPTRTTAHPISIDAAELGQAARAAAVERRVERLAAQFEPRRVLLGVDRLDYSKGILERLRAIELLLEQLPELRRTVAFVQVAVPSRGEVREYQELRQRVEELVGHINGRFTEPGFDVPVHYLHRSLTRTELLAYFRLADVCLVTPLADGMNLVAKEFVTAQAAAGGAGVLVLSEFTGAAAELVEALPCNPFDTAGLAGVVSLALELDEDDRLGRIAVMGARVARHDVFEWLRREIDSATAAWRAQRLRAPEPSPEADRRPPRSLSSRGGERPPSEAPAAPRRAPRS